MDVTLNAKLVFHLSVNCAPALEVGKTDEGCIFVIPITGGTFFGDGMGQGISGKILPGGADWNTRFGANAPEQVEASRVFAKYVIQTDDGVLIQVENEGFKSWKPEEQTKIITNPRFKVAAGAYGWLNYGVYVGSLESREDKSGVEINIYRME